MKRSILVSRIQKYVNPLVIILLAVILRLIPHPPNFAPIGAMALFGGAYLDKKYALAVPLLAMFISDIFLGFHSTMLFVYGSFLITGIIGILLLSKRKNFKNIIFASLISSLVFYIITNFGVWLVTNLYPKTIYGLLESYIMAIPFFRNTMLGDLFYNGIFFTSFYFVKGLVFVSLAKKAIISSKKNDL